MAGISQQELADDAEISKTSLNMIEQGGDARASTLTKLQTVLEARGVRFTTRKVEGRTIAGVEMLPIVDGWVIDLDGLSVRSWHEDLDFSLQKLHPSEHAEHGPYSSSLIARGYRDNPSNAGRKAQAAFNALQRYLASRN